MDTSKKDQSQFKKLLNNVFTAYPVIAGQRLTHGRIVTSRSAVYGEIMIERKKSSIATFATEYVYAFEYFSGRVQIVTKS